MKVDNDKWAFACQDENICFINDAQITGDAAHLISQSEAFILMNSI